MRINTTLKLNEDGIAAGNTSEICSGWVELEDSIKFPIKLRRYTKDGKEGLFVSYPQRKTKEGYTAVVYPHDKEVRAEIEESVMQAYQEAFRRFIHSPDVEEVKVRCLEPREENTPVVLRGYATVKMLGITINGIMIKEGAKGLFVQMPQHRSGDEYKDTVYGINKAAQYEIKNQVMDAYQEAVQKGQPETTFVPFWKRIIESSEVQKTSSVDMPKQREQNQPVPEQAEQNQPVPEQTEQNQLELKGDAGQPETWPESREALEPPLDRFSPEEGMERFLKALQENNVQQMAAVLAHTDMEVSQAEFTHNGNAVAFQRALLESGGYRIETAFFNQYNPMQSISPEKPLEQSILVNVWRNGNIERQLKFEEKKSKSLKNLAENYKDVLMHWKNLTNQKEICFDKVILNEADVKQAAPQGPKM